MDQDPISDEKLGKARHIIPQQYNYPPPTAPIINVMPSAPIINVMPSLTTSNGRSVDEYDELMKILSEYDINIVIDDSTSMMLEGRWGDCKEAIGLLIPYATKYDDDGVDIYFLNHKESYNVKKSEDINYIFSKIKPRGGTDIGNKLCAIFKKYFDGLVVKNGLSNKKPMNIIIITDGTPTDKEFLMKCIADFYGAIKNKGLVPKNIFGIQFYQVGTDLEATKFLEYMDNEYYKDYNIEDLIDCVPTDISNHMPLKKVIMKTLLGGIDTDIDMMQSQ
jgi:hypothetical protein